MISNGIDEVMDYPLMAEMSKRFRDAARALQDTVGETGKMAATIEGGVLLGQTGTLLSEAMKSDLKASLDRLAAKMDELAQRVDKAVETHKATVEKNKGIVSKS
jgi:hypothetical protein